MMSGNLLYDAIDKMVAEKKTLDEKLGLAESKLVALFSAQTLSMAKLNEAQAAARNSLNMAQEVERAALASEQAVTSIKFFGSGNNLQTEMASLKAEQVQLTAKLTAAQLAARNVLEMAQLTARAALEAENVLATAIEQAAILKVGLQPEQNL